MKAENECFDEDWIDLGELLKRNMTHIKRRASWPTFNHLDNQFQTMSKFAMLYEIEWPFMLKEFNSGKTQGLLLDIKEIDKRLFSPIEVLAWEEICFHNLGLYPQMPASRFHLDFACPFRQIAIELDGAKYHDAEKDKMRDEQLRQEGWTILRIPGKLMVRNLDRPYYTKFSDLEAVLNFYRHYFKSCGDGIIYAIAIVYLEKKIEIPHIEEIHDNPLLTGLQIDELTSLLKVKIFYEAASALSKFTH